MANEDGLFILNLLQNEFDTSRELQVAALEQLCLLVLRTDSADMLKRHFPPETFIPVLLRMFTGFDSTPLILESATRVLTYYLQSLPMETASRLFDTEGALCAICLLLESSNLENPIENDLAQQIIKFLEELCRRDANVFKLANCTANIFEFVSKSSEKIHLDTLRSGLSVVGRLAFLMDTWMRNEMSTFPFLWLSTTSKPPMIVYLKRWILGFVGLIPHRDFQVASGGLECLHMLFIACRRMSSSSSLISLLTCETNLLDRLLSIISPTKSPIIDGKYVKDETNVTIPLEPRPYGLASYGAYLVGPLANVVVELILSLCSGHHGILSAIATNPALECLFKNVITMSTTGVKSNGYQEQTHSTNTGSSGTNIRDSSKDFLLPALSLADGLLNLAMNLAHKLHPSDSNQQASENVPFFNTTGEEQSPTSDTSFHPSPTLPAPATKEHLVWLTHLKARLITPRQVDPYSNWLRCGLPALPSFSSASSGSSGATSLFAAHLPPPVAFHAARQAFEQLGLAEDALIASDRFHYWLINAISNRANMGDVLSILQSGQINGYWTDADGQPLLAWAFAAGYGTAAVALRNRGADVNSGLMGSAIHYATAYGHAECLSELLALSSGGKDGLVTETGIGNPRLRDARGRTPMQLALESLSSAIGRGDDTARYLHIIDLLKEAEDRFRLEVEAKPMSILASLIQLALPVLIEVYLNSSRPDMRLRALKVISRSIRSRTGFIVLYRMQQSNVRESETSSGSTKETPLAIGSEFCNQLISMLAHVLSQGSAEEVFLALSMIPALLDQPHFLVWMHRYGITELLKWRSSLYERESLEKGLGRMTSDSLVGIGKFQARETVPMCIPPQIRKPILISLEPEESRGTFQCIHQLGRLQTYTFGDWYLIRPGAHRLLLFHDYAVLWLDFTPTTVSDQGELTQLSRTNLNVYLITRRDKNAVTKTYPSAIPTSSSPPPPPSSSPTVTVPLVTPESPTGKTITKVVASTSAAPVMKLDAPIRTGQDTEQHVLPKQPKLLQLQSTPSEASENLQVLQLQFDGNPVDRSEMADELWRTIIPIIAQVRHMFHGLLPLPLNKTNSQIHGSSRLATSDKPRPTTDPSRPGAKLAQPTSLLCPQVPELKHTDTPAGGLMFHPFATAIPSLSDGSTDTNRLQTTEHLDVPELLLSTADQPSVSDKTILDIPGRQNVQGITANSIHDQIMSNIFPIDLLVDQLFLSTAKPSLIAGQESGHVINSSTSVIPSSQVTDSSLDRNSDEEHPSSIESPLLNLTRTMIANRATDDAQETIVEPPRFDSENADFDGLLATDNMLQPHHKPTVMLNRSGKLCLIYVGPLRLSLSSHGLLINSSTNVVTRSNHKNGTSLKEANGCEHVECQSCWNPDNWDDQVDYGCHTTNQPVSPETENLHRSFFDGPIVGLLANSDVRKLASNIWSQITHSTANLATTGSGAILCHLTLLGGIRVFNEEEKLVFQTGPFSRSSGNLRHREIRLRNIQQTVSRVASNLARQLNQMMKTELCPKDYRVTSPKHSNSIPAPVYQSSSAFTQLKVLVDWFQSRNQCTMQVQRDEGVSSSVLVEKLVQSIDQVTPYELVVSNLIPQMGAWMKMQLRGVYSEKTGYQNLMLSSSTVSEIKTDSDVLKVLLAPINVNILVKKLILALELMERFPIPLTQFVPLPEPLLTRTVQLRLTPVNKSDRGNVDSIVQRHCRKVDLSNYHLYTQPMTTVGQLQKWVINTVQQIPWYNDDLDKMGFVYDIQNPPFCVRLLPTESQSPVDSSDMPKGPGIFHGGLFHWLSTNGGREFRWANPLRLHGLVRLVSSDARVNKNPRLLGSVLASALQRGQRNRIAAFSRRTTLATPHTRPVQQHDGVRIQPENKAKHPFPSHATAWINFDLGLRIQLTHYLIQVPIKTDTPMITDWQLQGSNDSFRWTVLSEHHVHEDSDSKTYWGKKNERIWEVNNPNGGGVDGEKDGWRFLRIQLLPNAYYSDIERDADSLIIRGMEFYGTVTKVFVTRDQEAVNGALEFMSQFRKGAYVVPNITVPVCSSYYPAHIDEYALECEHWPPGEQMKDLTVPVYTGTCGHEIPAIETSNTLEDQFMRDLPLLGQLTTDWSAGRVAVQWVGHPSIDSSYQIESPVTYTMGKNHRYDFRVPTAIELEWRMHLIEEQKTIQAGKMGLYPLAQQVRLFCLELDRRKLITSTSSEQMSSSLSLYTAPENVDTQQTYVIVPPAKPVTSYLLPMSPNWLADGLLPTFSRMMPFLFASGNLNQIIRESPQPCSLNALARQEFTAPGVSSIISNKPAFPCESGAAVSVDMVLEDGRSSDHPTTSDQLTVQTEQQPMSPEAINSIEPPSRISSSIYSSSFSKLIDYPVQSDDEIYQDLIPTVIPTLEGTDEVNGTENVDEAVELIVKGTSITPREPRDHISPLLVDDDDDVEEEDDDDENGVMDEPTELDLASLPPMLPQVKPLESSGPNEQTVAYRKLSCVAEPRLPVKRSTDRSGPEKLVSGKILRRIVPIFDQWDKKDPICVRIMVKQCLQLSVVSWAEIVKFLSTKCTDPLTSVAVTEAASTEVDEEEAEQQTAPTKVNVIAVEPSLSTGLEYSTCEGEEEEEGDQVGDEKHSVWNPFHNVGLSLRPVQLASPPAPSTSSVLLVPPLSPSATTYRKRTSGMYVPITQPSIKPIPSDSSSGTEAVKMETLEAKLDGLIPPFEPRTGMIPQPSTTGFTIPGKVHWPLIVGKGCRTKNDKNRKAGADLSAQWDLQLWLSQEPNSNAMPSLYLASSTSTLSPTSSNSDSIVQTKATYPHSTDPTQQLKLSSPNVDNRHGSGHAEDIEGGKSCKYLLENPGVHFIHYLLDSANYTEEFVGSGMIRPSGNPLSRLWNRTFCVDYCLNENHEIHAQHSEQAEPTGPVDKEPRLSSSKPIPSTGETNSSLIADPETVKAILELLHTFYEFLTISSPKDTTINMLNDQGSTKTCDAPSVVCCPQELPFSSFQDGPSWRGRQEADSVCQNQLEVFHSPRITRKLALFSHDVWSVLANSHRLSTSSTLTQHAEWANHSDAWVGQFVTRFKYLFPFESRLEYWRVSSLGTSRAVAWMQKYATNGRTPSGRNATGAMGASSLIPRLDFGSARDRSGYRASGADLHFSWTPSVIMLPTMDTTQLEDAHQSGIGSSMLNDEELPRPVPGIPPISPNFTAPHISFGPNMFTGSGMGLGNSLGAAPQQPLLTCLGRLQRHTARVPRPMSVYLANKLSTTTDKSSQIQHSRVNGKLHTYYAGGENFWDCAVRLLLAHADKQQELDVEFEGEEGTGLGPTMEFYALLSAQLRRYSNGLWVSDDRPKETTVEPEAFTDSVEPTPTSHEVDLVWDSEIFSTDLAYSRLSTEVTTVTESIGAKTVTSTADGPEVDFYINPPAGLFPAPYPPELLPLEVVLRFYVLGIALAKCLVDQRQMDLPLSNAFLRILCQSAATNDSTLKFGNGHNQWPCGLLGLDEVHEIYPERGKFLQNLVIYIHEREMLRKYMSSEAFAKADIDLQTRIFSSDLESLCISLSFTSNTRRSGPVEFPLTDAYEPDPTSPRGEDCPAHIDLDMILSSENAATYVRRSVHFAMGKGIRKQMLAFKAGFERVAPLSSLSMFTPQELGRLISGESSPMWDASDLWAHCEPAAGYTRQSKGFQMLIETLVQFDPVQRRSFIRFVTGCPTLPPGGLKNLHPKLKVAKKDASTCGPFPSVNTCMHYLKLPEYDSVGEMTTYLLAAASQRGFYLN